MLDILTRACLHPMDYIGICRQTTITLKERIQESENTYSFIFTAPKLPSWKAGQHAIFKLSEVVGEDKGWRPFSIASAPHEGVIRIGTTLPPEPIKPSPFKQRLMSLEPGDTITMYGPYGEFFVSNDCNEMVAIVGGIGITPIRSITADLAKKQGPTKLHLIYSAKSPAEYTYKKELEDWSLENTNITITYTTTADEVNAEIDKEVERLGNLATYFISGSPKMIEAIRTRLAEKGMRRIVNDPFKGY